MEGSPPLVHTPTGVDEPFSVNYVKTRLPRFHSGFQNLPVQYDVALRRLTLDRNVATMPPRRALAEPGGSLGDPPAGGLQQRQVPAREVPPGWRAMNFWSEIFDEAIRQFITENPTRPPKLVEKPQYDIRGETNWDDVLAKLELAKAKFDKTESTFQRRAKKFYRYVTDHNDAAQAVVDVVPDSDYVSPVKAGVQILIAAAKRASDVRAKVTMSFSEDDLQSTFAKIELLLATFPGDENIRTASIDLITCTLKAVELAILYYLSHTLKRLLKVMPLVGDGSSFQDELITSINQISVSCNKLVDTAHESHMVDTKKATEMIFDGVNKLILLDISLGKKVKTVVEKVDNVDDTAGQLMVKMDLVGEEIKHEIQASEENVISYMVDLFNQGEKTKEINQAETNAKLDAALKKFLESTEKRYEALQIRVQVVEEENDHLKATKGPTPTPTPPPQQHQLPWHPPQGQLPWYPPPQSQWQAQSASQAPYAYQHPFPHPYQQQQQQLSPMPLQGLPYPPPPPGYPFPPPPPPEPLLSVGALLTLLNMPRVDAIDTVSILEMAESIGRKYRSRAMCLITTDEFRSWATSPVSCALLIQGDTRHDTVQSSDALSFVSASLAEGLRRQLDRFTCLVYYCRQHLGVDDPYFGPAAMIRSFIAQLLLIRQQGGQDFLIDVARNAALRQQDLEQGISDPGLQALRSGDVGALCQLFVWLVRRIVPTRKTVVCVMDGVDAYETLRHEVDLCQVVNCLLDLARDPTLTATMKVLATTPEGTVNLERAFDGEAFTVLSLEAAEWRGDEDDMLELEDEL